MKEEHSISEKYFTAIPLFYGGGKGNPERELTCLSFLSEFVTQQGNTQDSQSAGPLFSHCHGTGRHTWDWDKLFWRPKDYLWNAGKTIGPLQGAGKTTEQLPIVLSWIRFSLGFFWYFARRNGFFPAIDLCSLFRFPLALCHYPPRPLHFS